MEQVPTQSTKLLIWEHPYALEASATKRWRMCFLFGLFVFSFLAIFQPFGLSSYPQGIWKLSLGYGITTFAVMAFLNILVFRLMPQYFNEERWTVGKELVWSLINIAAIGIANTAFTWLAGLTDFSFKILFWYEFYTLVVGIFPVSIGILIRESRLKKRYEVGSEVINAEIETYNPVNVGTASPEKLDIPSDNAGEELTLDVEALYFVRSMDNYIEVHYRNGRVYDRKLLRSSLKKLEGITQNYPQLFRCHKSYMVNLHKVKHVSGNAQGYKLHLEGVEDTVPVSRTYNEEIKSRFTAGT